MKPHLRFKHGLWLVYRKRDFNDGRNAPKVTGISVKHAYNIYQNSINPNGVMNNV